jgi:hypothetical protein
MYLPEKAQDIDALIAELDAIINDCHARQDPLGLFAALYCRTTRNVREDILLGRFEDNPRMNELDTVFGNRYLEAYRAFRKNEPVCGAWRVAFEAGKRSGTQVYQHLLLGMNAHIHFDLGLSVAAVMNYNDPGPVRTDYLHINRILFRMIDGVQDSLKPYFPWLGPVDRMLGRMDEMVIHRLLRYARWDAWSVANQLATQDQAMRQAAIANVDAYSTRIATYILRSGGPLRRAARMIRLRNRLDLCLAIDQLRC